MLVKVGDRIFRRSGGCAQCGFCCRVDYTNLREYAALDRAAVQKTGCRFWPVCQLQDHDEEGRIICKSHGKSFGQCRTFPWHPLQLTNVDRDDLPRIPTYIHENTLWLGLPPELKDLAKFAGWAPFSKACPYKFTDVTDTLTDRQKENVKQAANPVVIHVNVDTRVAT